MKKILLTIVFLLGFATQAHAAFPGVGASYGYCQKWTMTAGGDVGGVATTTTAGFTLWATTTDANLAATSSSGHIQLYNYASSTPTDFILTSGTDCKTDAGSIISPIWDSYSSTTGQIAVGMAAPDISSTTSKTVLAYYGYVSDSDHVGSFSGSGLLGFWPFGTSTTNWPLLKTWDVSTAQAHGTLTNMAGPNNTVPGMIGSALNFDGVNDTVNMGDVNSFNALAAYTFSAWIYPVGFGGSGLGRIIDKRNNGSTGFQFYVASSAAGKANTLAVNHDGATAVVADNNTVVLNTWQYVTATFHGSTVCFYKNGALVISCSSYSAPSANTVALNIGNMTAGTRGFNGYIDNLSAFNIALDPMDVLTMYNNTSNSAVFWTFGAVETPSGGVTPPSSAQFWSWLSTKIYTNLRIY